MVNLEPGKTSYLFGFPSLKKLKSKQLRPDSCRVLCFIFPGLLMYRNKNKKEGKVILKTAEGDIFDWKEITESC